MFKLLQPQRYDTNKKYTISACFDRLEWLPDEIQKLRADGFNIDDYESGICTHDAEKRRVGITLFHNYKKNLNGTPVYKICRHEQGRRNLHVGKLWERIGFPIKKGDPLHLKFVHSNEQYLIGNGNEKIKCPTTFEVILP